MEHVRGLRDIFVDRVMGGSTDELDDDKFIQGYAKILAPNRLVVGDTEIEAESIIIATGSTPIMPAPWREFGDRIVTTDEFFELEKLPESMAIIGMGVIGLELGQALSRIGVSVTGVDALEHVSGLTDPVVNKIAIDLIAKEFPQWLGQPAELSLAGD